MAQIHALATMMPKNAIFTRETKKAVPRLSVPYRHTASRHCTDADNTRPRLAGYHKAPRTSKRPFCGNIRQSPFTIRQISLDKATVVDYLSVLWAVDTQHKDLNLIGVSCNATGKKDK
jgi:hypothetical protein